MQNWSGHRFPLGIERFPLAKDPPKFSSKTSGCPCAQPILARLRHGFRGRGPVPEDLRPSLGILASISYRCRGVLGLSGRGAVGYVGIDPLNLPHSSLVLDELCLASCRGCSHAHCWALEDCPQGKCANTCPPCPVPEFPDTLGNGVFRPRR